MFFQICVSKNILPIENFLNQSKTHLLQKQKLGKEKRGGAEGQKGRDEHDAGDLDDDDDDDDNYGDDDGDRDCDGDGDGDGDGDRTR